MVASHTGLSGDSAAAAAASDSEDEEQEEEDVDVASDVDSSLSLMVPLDAADDQELPMGDSRQLFRADLKCDVYPAKESLAD